MQFSETVVAAIIGAAATMSTALFQLYSMLRSRNKFDVRPKRGRTVRSVVAVIALMIASGVGGFLYSELRQQSAAEDIRGMRDELNAKLQSLTATTERLAAHESAMTLPIAAKSGEGAQNEVESVVFAACQSGTTCSMENPQRLTLCGAMPSAMQVRKVELFARPAGSQIAWSQAAANFEQDIGGAKFIGVPVEHAQDEAHKAVCVDFVQWGAEAHLARVVLHYGAAAESVDQQSSAAVVATQSPLSNTHIASMTPAATP
jgi:hypothetical protein